MARGQETSEFQGAEAYRTRKGGGGAEYGESQTQISGFLVFYSPQTSSSALRMVASLHMNQKRLTFFY